MYRRNDDRGQVESIGSVLFLGVVLVSMATFGIFYVANASSAAVAQDAGADTGVVRVDVSVDRLAVWHNGGASIPAGSARVVVRDKSGETSRSLASAGVHGDDDGLFEAGESWRLDWDRTPGKEVTVLVVNEGEGTVLYHETLTVPVAATDESRENRALSDPDGAIDDGDGPTDETPAGNEDPGTAYEDTDGDGEFTENDTRVDKSELLDGYDAGDVPLVIPDSVGEIQINKSQQAEFRGSSVDIESSIIAAKNLDITATNGNVSLVNANLNATGGGDGNGRLRISAPSGSVNATNASMYADKEITISARDDIVLERATLDGPTGGNGVSATATVESGDVFVSDARFLGGADPLTVDPSSAATGTPAEGSTN